MNKHYLFFLLFISFLILSCNHRNENKTKTFNRYLINNFHEKIPDNEHIYLLISTFRCYGCTQKILFEISEKVQNGEKNSITILTYDLNIVPQDLQRKVKVLLDKNAQYEHIGLSIANIALLKTNKGKIMTIQMINLDKIDSIVKKYFN